MSAAGEFIDSALQNETSAHAVASPGTGSALRVYGASVGAVRGTVRDASRKFPGLSHDEITALSSELWAEPVVERRLAAVVLLQANVHRLITTDLTRLEGFIRTSSHFDPVLRPLIDNVIVPFFRLLQPSDRARANVVLNRWSVAEEISLGEAARSVLTALA